MISPRSKAFSFIEVMLAVIILGIGFIMIGMMFPVAIGQAKQSSDETRSAALAGNAAAYVKAIGEANLLGLEANLNGQVVPISPADPTPPAWQLRNHTISSDDPRYAWVAFYSRRFDVARTNRLPFAQVTLICVQATNAPAFTSADIAPPTPGHWPNLSPRPVAVKICNRNGEADLVGFQERMSSNHFVDAAAEGAFVIISDDRTHLGRLNGRVYRAGARREDADGRSFTSFAPNQTGPVTAVDFSGMKVFELQPGNDFEIVSETDNVADDGSTLPEINGVAIATDAWIVGRSLVSPEYTGLFPTFEGPAMDVSAYTTFVQCRP